MFTRSVTAAEARRQYDYDENEEFGGTIFLPKSLDSDCEEWMKLLGCEFSFHGMQNNLVRLNDVVYEFLEDPDDGYRSHLGAVRISLASDHTGFFPNSIGTVMLVSTDDPDTWPDNWRPPEKDDWSDSDFSGFFLVDTKDMHIWCQIGTEYSDVYYPCFISRYTPKEIPIGES